MGGDGGFKKAAKRLRRTHRERAQPEARVKAGLGFLEKHKDYVERARAYHSKERRLKALMEKARFRNPDEFYFKMVNSKTKGGVHATSVNKRTESYDTDTMKLLKTQDANYITLRTTMESKKIERLQSTLHGIDMPVSGHESGSAGRAVKSPAPAMPKHVIFVDSKDEAKAFNPADHFDTVPELLDRPANRLRKRQLQAETLAIEPSAVKAVQHQRAKAYQELSERKERATKLKEAAAEVGLQRQLMIRERLARAKKKAAGVLGVRRGVPDLVSTLHAQGKGRKTKVGEDARGLPVYKWAQQRQK